MRVLVAEDNRRLAKTIRDLLCHNHYLVDMAADGNEAFDHACSGIYDILLLDVMLPGMDGFTMARELRSRGVTVPILMLTARAEISDRVKGLQSGADYYLTKPFANDELLACMRTLLQRSWAEEERLVFEEVSLELSSGSLFCGERCARLSAREQQIIEMLIRAGKSGVRRELFMQRIWEPDAAPEGNVLDVYISFLRKKLAYLRAGVGIAALRGFGYRIEKIGEGDT